MYLLVNDVVVLKLYGRILREAGFEVVENFTESRFATDLVSAHPFDVVVTDVLMPEVNGVEILRAIHHRDPGLHHTASAAPPTLIRRSKR